MPKYGPTLVVVLSLLPLSPLLRLMQSFLTLSGSSIALPLAAGLWHILLCWLHLVLYSFSSSLVLTGIWWRESVSPWNRRGLSSIREGRRASQTCLWIESLRGMILLCYVKGHKLLLLQRQPFWCATLMSQQRWLSGCFRSSKLVCYSSVHPRAIILQRSLFWYGSVFFLWRRHC